MTLRFQITLVRHGETDLNLKRTCQGHTDAELNDTGCKQALDAGKTLSNENFSHIFCSDLSRARKTCELILSQNVQYAEQNQQIKIDERIRERKFGVFEGQPVNEYYKLAKKANLSVTEYTPEGAETPQQMKSRAHLFLIDLFDQIYNENKQCTNMKEQCANILIVTHGGLIRYLLVVLEENYGCALHKNQKLLVMFNCARTCLLVTLTCHKDNEVQFVNHNDKPDQTEYTALVKCTVFNEVD